MDQETSCLPLAMQDQIAWLTLNQPQVGNAIDQDLMLALDQRLNEVRDPAKGVRCIVLTGAGANFCSGIDLPSMQVPRVDDQRCQSLMSRSFLDHLMERFLDLPIPVVAAVNGTAAGAGMTLALTADVIVMAENAFLLPSFVRLGLVSDNGVTRLLSDCIGPSRTRAALMLGDPISAKTAKEWGLA